MLSYILDIQQFGSGFGWDEEKKMVVGDRKQFMGCAKSRAGAAALYVKPFVNYEKLYEIYANDLAEGGNAKGPGDQFEIHEEQATINLAPTTKDSSDESHSQGPCHSSNPSAGTKLRGGRKRMFVEDDPVESSFAAVSKSIQSLVEVEKDALLHDMKVQKEIDDKRAQLFSVLSALAPRVVKAARIIGENLSTLNLLFDTPDEFKEEFVSQVIDGPAE